MLREVRDLHAGPHTSELRREHGMWECDAGAVEVWTPGHSYQSLCVDFVYRGTSGDPNSVLAIAIIGCCVTWVPFGGPYMDVMVGDEVITEVDMSQFPLRIGGRYYWSVRTDDRGVMRVHLNGKPVLRTELPEKALPAEGSVLIPSENAFMSLGLALSFNLFSP